MSISVTSDTSSPDETSNRLSCVEWVLISVATAIITAAVMHSEPLQSANDRSRWSTVWSLVERQTYQIDEIDQYAQWSTIDKVRFRKSDQEPWHFYSSKPPFLSTLVAGLYAVERNTLGYGLFNDTTIVSRILLLIVNVVPFLFALRSLGRTLLLLSVSLPARCFILAVAGFASILNPYLTTLNNHTPGVACAMFTISAAVRLLLSPSRGDFAWLGFFAAMTSCFELPAAQLGVAAFVLATFIDRKRTITAFMPAAVFPLAFFFLTNWMATGGVKPFYATYGSETYRYVHNGIPSYWMNPRDLDANQEHPLRYLFHCILGHHGLLSLTPALCLTLLGWFLKPRLANATPRHVMALRVIIASGAVMTLVTLGFYLTRTENYNYGGNSVGLRWMLWLFPFWWVAMVEPLQRAKFKGVVTSLLLLVLSAGTTFWSLQRPWKPSWIYEQMEDAGWIRYRTPTPPFQPERTTLFPGTLTVGLREQFVSSSGSRVTLETQAASDGTIEVWVTEAIIDTQTIVPGPDVPKIRLTNPGRALTNDALKTEDNSDTVRQISRMFGRVPFGRPFSATGTGWVPSKVNPEQAWKIDKGLDRVYLTDPFHGKCVQRCDVQFCDDLPFGVLRWKLSYLTEFGDELSSETWTSARL